jgi:Flp pilus assembly protein TadD
MAYTGLGYALGVTGDFESAIAADRMAIELEPANAEANCSMCFALTANGEFEEAVAAGKRAVLLDPKLAEAHGNLCAALAAHGDLDEAIAAGRTAIDLAPGMAQARENLAHALLKQGGAATTEGYQQLIKANIQHIDDDHGSAEPLDAQAWLLATCADPDQQDGSEAVRLAREACDLAPDDAHSFSTLGAAYCCSEDWPRAVDALERSIALARANEPAGAYLNATSRCFLAKAHAHLGEPGKAREDYSLAKAWHMAHSRHAKSADTARFLGEARATIDAVAKR